MRTQNIFIVFGLTLLWMLVLAFVWEFWLEDVIEPYFQANHEPEQEHERWEPVIVEIGLAVLALVIPMVLFIGASILKTTNEKIKRFHSEILENIAAGITLVRTKDGIIVFVNLRSARIFGYNLKELVGKHISVLNAPGKKSPEETSNEISDTLRKEKIWSGDVRNKKKDGTVIWCHYNVSTFEHPEHGEVWVGVFEDVTESKELEKQLASAQKMEALGQLTGGVAHEFNNMLFAITGNLELLAIDLKRSNHPTRRVHNALETAFKGSELTDRLLAYVGKQPLRPAVINVNELVTDTVKMLRPALGETIEIEIETADDIWPISIDPRGLDAALLNLAINARDAMPGGGKITIETVNCHLDEAFAVACPFKIIPGDYVMVSMGDTGTGMLPEVAKQAIDPFFTTKEVGKGTGLGLSMVYGFVKQSDGYIKIDSELGLGTVVRLYLPRVEPGEERAPEPNEDIQEPQSGKGTVLVVEDEPKVLDVTADMLEDMGYKVIKAENGPEALAQVQQVDRIDLLVTDVVMPGGMSGVQLAEAFQHKSPTSKVVFMTGHSDETIAANGLSENGIYLLRKPFRKRQLAKVVIEALDNGEKQ